MNSVTVASEIHRYRLPFAWHRSSKRLRYSVVALVIAAEPHLMRCSTAECLSPHLNSRAQFYAELAYAQAKDSSNPATSPLNTPAERVPNPREVPQEVGTVQEEVRDLSVAELASRSELADNPHSPDALAHLAQILSQEKKYAPAIRYWREATALDPGGKQLQLSLAVALSDNGDTAAAIKTLQTLTIQHPQFEPAFFSLASILCRTADYSNGIIAYRSALALQPTDDIARKSLIKALLSSQQFTEAIQQLDIYLRHLPVDAEGHYLLGKAYCQRNEGEDAELEFKRAVGIDPKLPDAEYSLGAKLLAAGRAEEAASHLQSSIALKPDDSKAHFQLSRAYRALHRPEDASHEGELAQSLKQTEIKNDRRDFLRDEAESLAHLDKLREAMAVYNEALALNPHDARLLYDTALIADRLKEQTTERQYLTRAEQSDKMLAVVHNQIAVLDTRQGDLPHATIELNSALTIDPTYAEALSNLGVVLAQRGDLKQAQSYFRRATEINPEYEQAHMNLGLVLAGDGQIEEAQREIQKVLLIDPGNSLARQIGSQIAASLHPTEKR